MGARWSLRARLLTVTVALLAAVSLVVGGVAVLALERVLGNRLDQQLVAAADRSARGLETLVRSGRVPLPDQDGRRDVGPGDGRAPLTVPGQAEGTLGVLVVDDQVVTSQVVDRSGDVTAVPAGSLQVLTELPADAGPRTVFLGEGLGRYRVLVSPVPGGGTFVTGLPLALVRGPVLALLLVVLVVSGVGVLLAAVLGSVLLDRALGPLRRVAATASRVAVMPLDRGEVVLAERVPAEDTDPATEVGKVGAALNHMLENVAGALSARQASETRVRQFVADASHELRTPLAAIRGYAELTRRSPEPVPEPVGRALARVESEAQRMSGLVDDLLLLARLDEGRPLDREPVDLSSLVVDAMGDARVAGPGHRWTLELPEEPVVVTGDQARLHQVVANLLANARSHTPPGTHVHVGLAPGAAGSARLTVADDGPGVPPELVGSVFERFARGDGSRSRAAGSTGLGLAIVAAVVGAHGGEVGCESRPGRTVFTVALP